MLGLIPDILQLLVSSIYVRWCKVDNVVSEYTGSEYAYSEILGELDGNPHILRFECKQISHRSNYSSRMWRSKVDYTYEVTLSEYVGKSVVYVEERTFPQLCAKFMNRSIAPHMSAINAHIDLCRHWDRAQ